FFVDNIPIWEFPKLEEMRAQYPSKEMSLYATIWDASRWATDGGRYRVDYQYQPFTATYADFIIMGCPKYSSSRTISPELCPSVFNKSIPSDLTEKQQEALKWVQRNHRFYSYCTDVDRYPNITDIPECAAERAQAMNQTGTERTQSMQLPSASSSLIHEGQMNSGYGHGYSEIWHPKMDTFLNASASDSVSGENMKSQQSGTGY
ncbi:hypothetical protein R1flu_018647, partial [Riccia fluitans]